MVLEVASVGWLEGCVYGSGGSVEIAWTGGLPISSSDWYDRHISLPKLGAVHSHISVFFSEWEYVLCHYIF